MLKKLRIKFVVLNMVISVCVLAVAFIGICSVSYSQDKATVITELETVLDSVNIPTALQGGENRQFNEGSQNFTPPEIGGMPSSGADFPIAVYQVTSLGMTIVPYLTTASLSADTEISVAKAMQDVADGSGTLSDLNLYYSKITIGQRAYAAFASTSTTDGWMSLARSLAITSLLALAAIFIISLFFSRWALKPVKEAWEQQRRFIADASHDLKTPLTVINANASILLDNPQASVTSMSQWIESTQTEVSQMQDLVNDMLLLARIDEGEQISRQFEPVDLSETVEGLVLEFESVAFERQISLETQIEPGLRVQGDNQRLHRLASTLIDNACKYVGIGGRVWVECKRGKGGVVFCVGNNGSPISPEDLPHVFDRFYRSDEARTRNGGETEGHGLGLAIAQAIAQEHGGTLSASSSAEEGTVFTATLPLQ